ncbi:MAG: carbohydrate deacetylase [Planctomycetota bacterium]
MKYLIVTGDDFGASPGVNRGILEAHRRGILTSTSVMVDMPWSEEAGALARVAPDLSVGLHVQLDGKGEAPTPPGDCLAEILRQLRRFEELLGRPPTHIDSHHNVHRHPWSLPAFREAAALCARPLRWESAVRCVSSFYGRWGGESHPEQIGVEYLLRLVRTEFGEGATELCCHPGYADPDLRSSYFAEREIERATLCDPAVRAALEERGIALIGFRDLPPGLR